MKICMLYVYLRCDVLDCVEVVLVASSLHLCRNKLSRLFIVPQLSFANESWLFNEKELISSSSKLLPFVDLAIAAIADSLNADLKTWTDPSHAKGAEMNTLKMTITKFTIILPKSKKFIIRKQLVIQQLVRYQLQHILFYFLFHLLCNVLLTCFFQSNVTNENW